jgi:energy-coupling factor transporter ATP-binding protein EcfA2
VADLIVVTGPPGAGKSTVAKALAGLFEPSALVAGDQFFTFVEQGYIDPWLPEARQQNGIVVSAAAAAAGRLAAGGYTVVYDGMIHADFVGSFGAAAGVSCVHYVVLYPSEELCIKRVRERSGHGFTDLDAARQMYAEFNDAALASAEIDRRHVLDDIDDGADAAVLAALIRDLVRDGFLLVGT